MQDLKITVIQTDQLWEDKQGNLTHFDELIKQVPRNTDIIVLPEMFHTGFSMRSQALAEEMEGIGIDWLSTKANEFQSAIVASLIIKEESKYYNRMVFIEPSGKIHYYDKRKLFGLANEDQYYEPGKSNKIINYKGWKLQLQICYDLRFPEIARNELTHEGSPLYDVLLYVANWPERRRSHWRSLLQARAIENQCFVVAANRVGSDANGLNYSGDSSIIHPLGEVLHHYMNEEKVFSAVLNYNELTEVREKLPFLKDR
jgi:omega-amidase